MNPNNESRLIAAFVDDELELTRRLDIEDRMRLDPTLALSVERLREMRGAIRERADYHDAPASLRERIVASLAAEGPNGARTPAAVARAAPRWLAWRPLGALLGVVAVLALALNLAWLQSVHDESLLDAVVASHVRSTLGEHLVDIASSDHHTVKPWLSSKLDFSPPVDELPLAGSVFLGGRIDYLDGRPVAALVYRQGAHLVNSFVWPTRGADSGPEFAQRRGFQTTHWSSHGMTHWVISDVSRAEFDGVVDAIRSADARRQ